jgi:hypothetical protein
VKQSLTVKETQFEIHKREEEARKWEILLRSETNDGVTGAELLCSTFLSGYLKLGGFIAFDSKSQLNSTWQVFALHVCSVDLSSFSP